MTWWVWWAWRVFWPPRRSAEALVDIQISPYAIRGFEGQPQAEPLLRQALEMGADLVGGVPEADDDPVAHVDRIFALAKEFGLDIDFHTDQVSAARPFALPTSPRRPWPTGCRAG